MSAQVYSAAAVKRAAWQFLTGKALSAALTFVILLWLVRLLPLADYGAYVVLIAGTELGFALAGLGLPWLAARYVPDYRLHAGGRALARLCGRLVLWQSLALAGLAFVVVLLLETYLAWAGMSVQRGAAGIALALLVAEGLARFLREGLMAPLMLQGQARASMVGRQALFLAAIALLSHAGSGQLQWVLLAELGASLSGLTVAAFALVRHLRALHGQPAEPGWQPPGLAQQWRVALRMHAAHVVTLAYGPQVFLNLVQRALGADAAALFGFVRTLSDQVARYLPALLFLTVLRPKLMASHLQGGMAALTPQVNLVGKLSLFVLLPIIVVVGLAGDTLLALLSGGKFPQGGVYLVGLLLSLVPFSQRQLIETAAVASGWADLCTLGALAGLLALPLALGLLGMGLGLWAPVLAMLLGQIAFNATVLSGLARTGYRPDWPGAMKLAASAALAWLMAEAVLWLGHGRFFLLAAVLVAGLVFLALAWRFQVFDLAERQRLDHLLGRKLLSR